MCVGLTIWRSAATFLVEGRARPSLRGGWATATGEAWRLARTCCTRRRYHATATYTKVGVDAVSFYARNGCRASTATCTRSGATHSQPRVWRCHQTDPAACGNCPAKLCSRSMCSLSTPSASGSDLFFCAFLNRFCLKSILLQLRCWACRLHTCDWRAAPLLPPHRAYSPAFPFVIPMDRAFTSSEFIPYFGPVEQQQQRSNDARPVVDQNLAR